MRRQARIDKRFQNAEVVTQEIHMHSVITLLLEGAIESRRPLDRPYMIAQFIVGLSKLAVVQVHTD
jgi:hypothetical protein